jgi:hypothetical protein
MNANAACWVGLNSFSSSLGAGLLGACGAQLRIADPWRLSGTWIPGRSRKLLQKMPAKEILPDKESSGVEGGGTIRCFVFTAPLISQQPLL